MGTDVYIGEIALGAVAAFDIDSNAGADCDLGSSSLVVVSSAGFRAFSTLELRAIFAIVLVVRGGRVKFADLGIMALTLEDIAAARSAVLSLTVDDGGKAGLSNFGNCGIQFDTGTGDCTT